MDKRINNGGARKGAGRKGKAEEQKLIEHLTPMNGMALESLQKGLERKEQWAVKLFFEYFSTLPSWFTNLWILVVASIFGIKGTQVFRNGGKK